MELLTQIPQTPIGWIALSVLIVVTIFFGVSKVRANDMQILRDTNRDQGDRITLLETAVNRLEDQLKVLQHQNKTLEDLVVVALKQFFFENPTVAHDMKKKVLS